MRGETVTVVRSTPGGTDQYGDTIATVETRTIYAGCALSPRRNAESREIADRGRQGVIVGLTLYGPSDMDITAADHVEARGEVFEVDGEAGLWVNPFTNDTKGVEVALRRVEG